jgi:CSLREA domain-containing protein
MYARLKRQTSILLAISSLIALGGLVAAPSPASAQDPPTFTVTTTSDSSTPCSPSTCTLRAALQAANATSGAVVVVPAGNYPLTKSLGPLIATKPMSIVGTAPSSATVVDADNTRVLEIRSGANVTIRNLTIADGNAGRNLGGGILVQAGATLNLESSTVRENRANEGAGIHNSGSLRVSSSTINANTASGKGGGLFNAGTALILNSTIDGNSAKGGGGIASSGATEVVFSTVTSNTSNNSNGGGIYRVGGVFVVKSSVLAYNGAPDERDCYGSPTFVGVNLIESSSGCNPNGQVILANPLLGPLADNGGPTRTRLPADTSPVIDRASTCEPTDAQGNQLGPISTDQRGVGRPSRLACDLGSLEVADPPLDVTIDLRAGDDAPSGVTEVPTVVIPPRVLSTSTVDTTDSAALGSIALGSIALGSIDVEESALGSIALGSIALGSIALGSIGFDDTAFSTILLTQAPLRRDGGWETYLRTEASDLADVPLQALTLADVLAVPAVAEDLDLADVDFSATPLALLPAVVLALGDVQLDDIGFQCVPGCDLGTQTPLSAALGSIALGSIALGSIALGSIDGMATALGSIALGSIALGSIQVEGTALGSIALGSIQVEGTALGSIALSSIALGSIGIDGYDCATPDLDCENDTLADAWDAVDQTATLSDLIGSIEPAALGSIYLSDLLEVAALGSIDLSATALGSIALGSIEIEGTALGSIALGSIDVEQSALGSIALSSIELGSIALGSIGPIDCSAATPQDCTLADVFADGAIDPAATLTDLLGAIEPSALGSITLADLLATLSLEDLQGITLAELFPALFPSDQDLPWEEVDLQAAPLQNLNDPLVAPVKYEAAIRVVNQTSAVTFTLDLADGFVVATPSTVTLRRPDGSSSPLPFPAAAKNDLGEDVAGPTLTFGLGTVTPGTYTLTLEARAGIQLGLATSTGSITATTARGEAKSATDTASVDVIEGNEGTSLTIDDSKVYVSHISTPGDVDLFRFVVATQPSTVDASVEISLGNLRADFDLVLFGPTAEPLRGAPTESVLPVDDEVIGLEAGEASPAPDVQRDIPLDPPEGLSVVAVSADRGTTNERIVRTTRSGTYYVQVSGYNGATSDLPYALRLRKVNRTLPACSARNLETTLDQSDRSGAVPDGTDTVFVVAPNRLRQLFGSKAAEVALSAISTFVTSGPAGVKAAVINVDADAGVVDSFNEWDKAEGRCSPDAANDVARAIAAVVDTAIGKVPVKHLVLVGDDLAMPMFRLPDGTTVANERTHTPFAGANSLMSSLNRGFFLSDDPYATPASVDFGGTELFVQKRAVGRLVETPDDIAGALQRFIHYEGRLDPATATAPATSLVTGYDFLTDGASAIANALAANGRSVESLNDAADPWTATELAGALQGNPTLASINAHFDHYRLLPADQDAANSENELFTLDDITDVVERSLIFSMGCHAGLSVSDLEIGSALNKDWAQVLSGKGAELVGNTGYGYGDSELVLYSERLMALFAQSLDGSLTIGEALALAKRQYAATQQVWSPYDAKALQQAVTYGLPMYRVGGSGEGVNAAPEAFAPIPPSIVTSAITTGASTQSIVLDLGAALVGPTDTGNGSYYSIGTDGVMAVKDRPVQPLATVDVTRPGLVAHGALITALVSDDTSDFTPYFAQPVVDLTTNEVTGDAIGDAIFPATLTGLSRSQDAAGSPEDSLLFSAGQFRPGSLPGVGTQRRFTDATVEVQYSNDTTDFVGPTIVETRGELLPLLNGNSVSAQTIEFDVDTSVDAVVAYVLFKPIGATYWRGVYLTRDGATWRGRAPVEVEVSEVEFFVQACDVVGNCSTSNNKASDFVAVRGAAIPGVVDVTVTGPLVNGWFTSTATVTISNGTSYQLDGGEELPYQEPFQVSGEGIHVVKATGDTGTVIVTVLIDSAGPVVTAELNPPPNERGWVSGATVVTLEAIDGLSGPATFTYYMGGTTTTVADGSVAIPVEAADGITTIGYTAVDYAGNTTSGTVEVKVDGTAPTLAMVVDGVNTDGWSKTVPTTATITATDGLSTVTDLETSPTGTLGYVGQASSVTILTGEGVTTVAATATDGAGNQSTLSQVVRVDATAPAVTVAASPQLTGSASWYTTASVDVTFTATDALSGVKVTEWSTGGSWTQGPDTTTVTVSSEGLTTVRFRARDMAGNTTELSYEVRIDRTKPTVAISSPTPEQRIPIGSAVSYLPADPCVDTGSGLASCIATVTNGANQTSPVVPGTLLNTTAPGTFTYTVTATDQVGLTTSLSVIYRVVQVYEVRLLYNPAKPQPLGGNVTIRLQIWANGANVSSPSLVLTATALRDLDASATYGPPFNQGNSNPNFEFRYDASQQGYVYNFDSDAIVGLHPGDYELSFIIGGDTEATYAAPFKLK